MSRRTRSRRSGLAVLGAVALVLPLALLLGGGAEPLKLQVQLSSANGLREGSQVKLGGAEVGKIAKLELNERDDVVAALEIEPGTTRIRRDASVQIVPSNLLGTKYLSIDPGRDTAQIRPGSVIPASRVSYPVDLDQLLDVFDADTRMRLRILINEAGIALGGRGSDLNEAMGLLPRNLEVATDLLRQIGNENGSLRQLVDRSDRFIRSITRERRDLTRLVASAGQMMETVSARRAELRRTLSEAPEMLVTAQRFLKDLDATTRPLGPAARDITASAPALASTLGELPSFERSARPLLTQAAAVAPSLGRLGNKAAPVVGRANGTLDALVGFARSSSPLMQALDVSIDDLLATMEGWARAIQERDGVGHWFRGDVLLHGETLNGAIRRLQGSDASDAGAGGRRRSSAPDAGSNGEGQDERDARRAGTPPSLVPNIRSRARDLLNLVPETDSRPRGPAGGGDEASLLDYLLGP